MCLIDDACRQCRQLKILVVIALKEHGSGAGHLATPVLQALAEFSGKPVYEKELKGNLVL